jgi:hypothetical protein
VGIGPAALRKSVEVIAANDQSRIIDTRCFVQRAGGAQDAVRAAMDPVCRELLLPVIGHPDEDMPFVEGRGFVGSTGVHARQRSHGRMARPVIPAPTRPPISSATSSAPV